MMMHMLGPLSETGDGKGWPLQIPRHVTDSDFFKRGGADIVRGLFSRSIIDQLAQDAREQMPLAHRSILYESDNTWEGRGGKPARALSNIAGTQLQFGIYMNELVVRKLSQLTGLELSPTGGGTYSYYHKEGDFLALHRDVLTCDVTVITCLENSRPTQSGALYLYPNHILTPLSELRGRADRSGVVVDLEPGDVAILLGSVVPHEVSPLPQGQHRTVALMCYRVAGWA